MKFWDSSALVPLFVAERASSAVRALHAADQDVLAWLLTDVEIRSTLARLGREGALSPRSQQDVIRRVEAFWETVHVFSLVEAVKPRAKRLLGLHPLRSADALQLGAALAAASNEPASFEFVCLDERLSDAARREGFSVVP